MDNISAQFGNREGIIQKKELEKFSEMLILNKIKFDMTPELLEEYVKFSTVKNKIEVGIEGMLEEGK